MTSSELWKESHSFQAYQAFVDQRDVVSKLRHVYEQQKQDVIEEHLHTITLIKRERITLLAEISELRKEAKEAQRKAKEAYKNQVFLVKEDVTLKLAEMTRDVELQLLKYEMNAKAMFHQYDVKIKAGDAKAKEDKETFKKAYLDYYKKQETFLQNDLRIKKEAIHKDQTLRLESLKKSYLKTLEGFQKHYHTKTYDDGKMTYQQYEISRRKKKSFQLKKMIHQTVLSYPKYYKEHKPTLDQAKDKYLNASKTFQLKKKDLKQAMDKAYQKDVEMYKTDASWFKTYIKQSEKSYQQRRFDEREKKIFRRINPAYLYVMPAAMGALFFTVLPFIFMLIASLFKVNLSILSQSRFIGFENFTRIFKYDTEFQKAFSNTLIYAFVTVVLLIIVVIAMAAWLARNTKIHNAAQTMIFTPHIASLVAISILWIAMLNPSGIINQVLAWFGIEGPGWLIQENTSLISVSFVTIWKDIGYYVLIIISGLQAIPAYIYEAAKLDKASKVQTFFKMTLPLLTPTLSFVFVTKFIASFKVFAPIEIMTNGGPMGSSMVLSYWIYKVGRIGFNYGNAMAGAVVLTILIGVFTFINYRFFKKQVVY